MKNVQKSLGFAACAGVMIMLAACGGGSGGDAPSVQTMSVQTPVRYGQSTTIAIVGRNLGATTLAVDGRCDDLTRLATSTEDNVQYSCVVRTIGEMVPRLRDASGGRELGSVRVTIPLPRVSVTIGDGTRSGTFVIELDPQATPITVDNFLAYVTATGNFYRNTVIAYASAERGILLGGYTANAAGALQAKATTRAPITLEASAQRKHERGTVGMFRRGDANSATSEWFVNTQNNTLFDVGSAENPLGFAVFGRIVEGLDIVDIAAGVPVRGDAGTGFDRVPSPNVGISSISQTR